MKKIIYIVLLISLFIGCKEKIIKPNVSYHYFEPWQLEYNPYKLGDTLSFTNELNGQILHYKCKYYNRYLRVGDTTECPNDMEFCNVHAEEVLEVGLNCLENENQNFFLYYNVFGKKLYFQYKKIRGDESMYGTIERDSTCNLSTNRTHPISYPDVQCIGTVNIRNKIYLNVAKLSNPSFYNPTLDTLYYNKTSGLLRFCLKNGDQWNKN